MTPSQLNSETQPEVHINSGNQNQVEIDSKMTPSQHRLRNRNHKSNSTHNPEIKVKSGKMNQTQLRLSIQSQLMKIIRTQVRTIESQLRVRINSKIIKIGVH